MVRAPAVPAGAMGAGLQKVAKEALAELVKVPGGAGSEGSGLWDPETGRRCRAARGGARGA